MGGWAVASGFVDSEGLGRKTLDSDQGSERGRDGWSDLRGRQTDKQTNRQTGRQEDRKTPCVTKEMENLVV